MSLPWDERVTQLSIHPEAATVDMVARLASKLIEAGRRIKELERERNEARKAARWASQLLPPGISVPTFFVNAARAAAKEE